MSFQAASASCYLCVGHVDLCHTNVILFSFLGTVLEIDHQEYVFQSSPIDTCDNTRTRCHTGKISYECDLSHEQDKTFLKFPETKFFTSNLSLVIFKKIFAFYLHLFSVCLQLQFNSMMCSAKYHPYQINKSAIAQKQRVILIYFK